MSEGLRIVLETLFGDGYWLGFEQADGERQCPGQLQLELDIDSELTAAGYVRDSDGRWYRGSWRAGVLRMESMPDDFDPRVWGT